MRTRKLHVITCISNPVRYSTRYNLYKTFAKQMADAGVDLYTVEMAFGDRDHVVTDANNPFHIQVRSKHETWAKEAMLNIALRFLPNDWEYVAWIDADVMFVRPDWVNETIEQLQHYDFVQLFSHAQDVGPRFEPMKIHTGFMHDYYHGTQVMELDYMSPGHPGYAWAATRGALDAVGGFIDHGILGSGDRHMADAMIGKVDLGYHPDIHTNYKALCLAWQKRCLTYSNMNVGYMSGTINHYFHGSKNNRQYTSRWKLLVDHQYDPMTDVVRDTQGLWTLDHTRRELRDDIRRYFRARHEDDIFTGSYKLLP